MGYTNSMTTLGLLIWLGVLGSPTKVVLPTAEVAVVSLQNEIAAETDTIDAGSADSEDPGHEDEAGSVEESE